MQYTTNYNLKKPGYTDLADIEDINSNMDIIDTELEKRTKAENITIMDIAGHFTSSDVEGALSELVNRDIGSGTKIYGREGEWRQAPVPIELAATYNSPNSVIGGLTSDGDYFYAGYYKSGGEIYKTTLTFSVVTSWDDPGDDYVCDLAFKDGYIYYAWFYGMSAGIRKCNSSGTYFSGVDISDISGISDPRGLTVKGDYLWYSISNTSYIITTDGTLIEEVEMNNVDAMHWDGEQLITCAGGATVNFRNDSGTIISSFTITDEDVTAVYKKDGYYYFGTDDTDKVYKYSAPFTCLMPK